MRDIQLKLKNLFRLITLITFLANLFSCQYQNESTDELYLVKIKINPDRPDQKFFSQAAVAVDVVSALVSDVPEVFNSYLYLTWFEGGVFYDTAIKSQIRGGGGWFLAGLS